MSDTKPVRAVARKTATINNRSVELFATTFGNDRKLELKRLTMGDQFDLAEMMTDTASRLWTSMALVAASLVSIDGVPVSPGYTRAGLRSILDQLGEDGVAAANDALATSDENRAAEASEAAQRAQVGNSLNPVGSGK